MFGQIALPPLLQRLLSQGHWQQPSDAALTKLFPMVKEPLDLLLTEERMRFESGGSGENRMVDDPELAEFFRFYRGSGGGARALPWLDAELMLFIAVCRVAGDDVAVALDYRTSPEDPSVVASEWTDRGGCYWRLAFPTFSALVAALA